MNWIIPQTVDRLRGADAAAKRQAIQPLAYPGNGNAHVWEVTVLDNGQPADLTGVTVVGYFMRADGNAVAVAGTVSGNKASVTFATEVYVIPGLVKGVMNLTIADTSVTPISAISFVVQEDITSDPIDPSGEITLDVGTLVADIEAATASIPADYSDLLGTIADTFSSSTAYAAGDYVWYDGTLYKFTAAHAAGSWSGTDASAVVLANDLADLKSRLDDFANDVVGGNNFNIVDGATATIVARMPDNVTLKGGNLVYTANSTGSNYVSVYIPIEANTSYDFAIGNYSSLEAYGYKLTNTISDSWVPSGYHTDATSGTLANVSNTYISFSCVARNSFAGAIPLTVKRHFTDTVFELLEDLDAADATLGNRIDGVNADIASVQDTINVMKGSNKYTVKDNYYINSTGAEASSELYELYVVDVIPGKKVFGRTGNVSNADAYLAFYNANGALIGDPIRNPTANIYNYDFVLTAPNNAVTLKVTNRKAWNVPVYIATGDISQILEELYDYTTIAKSTNYAEMFHRVGVIGDSLASGEIAYQSGGSTVYVDKYDYSWLSNMCRNCGTEAEHYSKGGMMAKTWLQDQGGMKTKFDNDEVCNAYFIALGTNEIGHSETLGNITDASGADSFVGYMKQIIEYVHTKAANAVIFLVSTYAAGSTSATWSAMIEQIAGLYGYCYYVDFIGNTDLYTTSSSPYTSLGHFTTPAYVAVGKTINKLVNDIVYNNYSDFMLFAVNN